MTRPGVQSIRSGSGQPVVLAHSITWLDKDVTGTTVVSGSHGGVFAALVGGAWGAKALVFNDAGVGKDNAGVSGLTALEEYGIAAAAIDYRSARIGDAGESYSSGRISFVNIWAAAAGITVGSAARDAVERLGEWAPVKHGRPEMPIDHIRSPTCSTPGLVVLDSASGIVPSMARSIVITGSHGGLVGGFALKFPVGAAFFNDAGFGKDDAGISRIASLDKMRIPAAAMSHQSARIGDGLDSYNNGVLSYVNRTASAAGVFPGQTVKEAARVLANTIG